MVSAERIDTDHEAYAARRPAERARMIPIRRARRVHLGDMLAVEFENADTLTYQVQEMVHTERLTDPAEIAHEIEVYRRLLPSSHELCATVFIELADPTAIRAELAQLAGIQHALSLQVGDHTVPGVEIPGPDEDAGSPSETVSVHMVRFHFNDATRDAFRDPQVPVSLQVTHPAYDDSAPITGPTRTQLLADLAL